MRFGRVGGHSSVIRCLSREPQAPGTPCANQVGIASMLTAICYSFAGSARVAPMVIRKRMPKSMTGRGSIFQVAPQGPFSLEMANQYFGGWIQAALQTNLRIAMAFPLEGANRSACVVLEQLPDGSVTGQVYGSADVPERARIQALSVLSLDVDGGGFADVGERDSVVQEVQRRYEGLRPVLFHSPYEAAAAFVIGHRISIAQGRAIRRRLAAEHGEAIDTDVGVQHAFPTPEALLQIDTFTGIAAAKWRRLHAVAQATLDGVLDRATLRAMPVADALTLLRTIPGLGPFFSQGVLIRGAGTVDVVSDDEVTKQAVQQAIGSTTCPTRRRSYRLLSGGNRFARG